jgi:hypothetical protein
MQSDISPPSVDIISRQLTKLTCVSLLCLWKTRILPGIRVAVMRNSALTIVNFDVFASNITYIVRTLRFTLTLALSKTN